jgi:opacity protein-like surface antigen
VTQTAEADWLSTVRARLGFAPTNNILIFGTAGGAFGKVNCTS